MSTHTEKQCFYCEICRAKFSQNADFKRFILTYSAEKPFHCGISGAKFSHNPRLGLWENVNTQWRETFSFCNLWR